MATWSPGDRESPPPAGARTAQQPMVRQHCTFLIALCFSCLPPQEAYPSAATVGASWHLAKPGLRSLLLKHLCCFASSETVAGRITLHTTVLAGVLLSESGLMYTSQQAELYVFIAKPANLPVVTKADALHGAITAVCSGTSSDPRMDCTGGGLLSERLEPRVGLPPLLTNLGDRPPEALQYLGASFGLTQSLFSFWARAGYAPVYLRQNPSDVTGPAP